jgi:hypothetical protein
MKRVYLDIETACDKDGALALLPPFYPAEVKVGNLKDEAKIAAKIAEAQATHESDFLDNSALYAERGKIVAIGLREEWKGGLVKDTLLAEDEATMLEAVWPIISAAILENEKIIGHYHLNFDLPYMVRRSWILGIPVPPNVRTQFRGRFYWAENFIDTCVLWKLDQRDQPSSLDYVAQALGVGKKTGDGKDFAELLLKDREAALEYLRNDLILTAGIAKKMGV